MSKSGIAIPKDCIDKFQNLKLRKEHKYIIYGIDKEHGEVVVKQTGSSQDYKAFVDLLPENECRYAVYDFEYELPGGEGKRNKICFYIWSPDTANIKDKMIFASSKEGLRFSLTGIGAEIQGTDYSEVAYETVLEKVSKHKFSNN